MSLKRKKIACLIALPHHTRFLMPVAIEARKHKAEVIFFLTMADYPFERDLIKSGQRFRYLTDYLDNVTRGKIDVTLSQLLDIWKSRCFRWDGFRHWTLFEQSRFFNATIEEYFCLEKFIEKESPDLFIALHERNRWGKLTGHLANKYGIPYVTFQEGDYHEGRLSFSAHTEYSTADLIWGEASRDMLISHKSAADKLVLIGNTHLENAIKIYSDHSNKKKIIEELGIPAGRKIVLILLDLEWAAIIDKRVWAEFFKGINNEIIFIFKWHPNALLGTYKKAEEALKDISPETIILYTYDPYSLLAIADYCVTLGKTTLALEALCFGKPLFALPSRDGTKDYYVKMGVAQSVAPVGNWSNLYKTIESGIPEDIKKNVDEYLKKSFYRLDGKAIERALEVMDHIVTCRQKTKSPCSSNFVKEGKKGHEKSNSREYISRRVSFVIPTGNNQEAFLSTLTSLAQNIKYPDWETILVANNEDIKGMLSGISGDMKIVEAQGDNLACLYNKGAGVSSGELLIFMRPGVVYFKDDGLLVAMKDGIAGMPLKNPDMTSYCLGIGFDFNFAPYFITDPEFQILNTEFHAVGGGFIGMHRDVFETIGGFDEGIYNNLIEADICLSAKDKGYPIRYLPDCLGFVYKETFIQKSKQSEDGWRRRIKFFAKWCGRLPKDEDYLKFAKDLLAI